MNNGVCSDLAYTFACACMGDYGGTTCNMPALDGVDFVELFLCPGPADSSSDVGIITSQDGAQYSNGADCGLHIETSAGTAIQLTFTSFSLEANFDYVYVYDGDSSSAQQLARLDGTEVPVTVTTFGGNHMFVRMATDGSVASSGFEAIWSTLDPSALPPPPPPDPCGGGIQLTGGGDINFSGGYGNGLTCSWTLTCPGTLTLDFSAFATESNFDFVTVKDGADNSGATLYSGSGTYSDGQLASSGSSLWVEFTSDGAVTQGKNTRGLSIAGMHIQRN